MIVGAVVIVGISGKCSCYGTVFVVGCLPWPNDRFQRKDYAPIHIVKTEKKGFGLRAAEDLRKCVLVAVLLAHQRA